MPLQARMRFAFNIAMVLLFAYTTYEAWGFRSLARYLPFSISLLALVVMLVGLLIDIVAYRRTGVVAGDDVPVTAALAGSEVDEQRSRAGGTAASQESGPGASDTGADAGDAADVSPSAQETDEAESPREILKRSGVVFLWILSFLVGMAVLGLVLASSIFLLSYLFLQARANWKIPVFGTIAILALMFAMRTALNLEWPPYLLETTFEGWFGFG